MGNGFLIWVPLISTLAGAMVTGIIQYSVNRQNHKITLKREEKASKDKLEKERYFLATELVVLLEQFAQDCARVATDPGHYNDDRQPVRVTVVDYPGLDFTDVSGDWRALSPTLMYRIRQLVVQQKDANSLISATGENDHPPDYDEFYAERHYQYARLGMKAIIQASRLRSIAGLPGTRLGATRWSALSTLRRVLQQERRRRLKLLIKFRQKRAEWDIQDGLRDVRAEADSEDKAPPVSGTATL